jgi:hypothetical protein
MKTLRRVVVVAVFLAVQPGGLAACVALGPPPAATPGSPELNGCQVQQAPSTLLLPDVSSPRRPLRALP